VGPSAGLDSVVWRKIPRLYRDKNPPIIQPIAESYTTELSRLLKISTKREKEFGETSKAMVL
jgi:hypothetical protein